jgi:hypothetical protein
MCNFQSVLSTCAWPQARKASIIAKRWIEPAEIIGGMLLALAIIDVLIVPTFLIRRWRSEP